MWQWLPPAILAPEKQRQGDCPKAGAPASLASEEETAREASTRWKERTPWKLSSVSVKHLNTQSSVGFGRIVRCGLAGGNISLEALPFQKMLALSVSYCG